MAVCLAFNMTKCWYFNFLLVLSIWIILFADFLKFIIMKDDTQEVDLRWQNKYMPQIKLK